MAAIVTEKGVLKLVHPGRYVEIHKEPVTAAEVMRKNPRHSITRPDIFEYPWIVVKPGSVLNLGRVFFIVPNRTIYDLLKAREQQNQSSSQQTQSPKKQANRLLKQNSPVKFSSGMTPKHQNRSREKQSLTMTWGKASPWEQDYGKRFKRQSRVESLPEEMTTKYRNSYLEFKRNRLLEDSTNDIRSCYGTDYYFIDRNINAETPKKDDFQVSKRNEEVKMLKSCLRKQDSVRKSLRFRVSFVMPIKDEEDHPRRVAECQMKFKGFSIC